MYSHTFLAERDRGICCVDQPHQLRSRGEVFLAVGLGGGWRACVTARSGPAIVPSVSRPPELPETGSTPRQWSQGTAARRTPSSPSVMRWRWAGGGSSYALASTAALFCRRRARRWWATARWFSTPSGAKSGQRRRSAAAPVSRRGGVGDQAVRFVASLSST